MLNHTQYILYIKTSKRSTGFNKFFIIFTKYLIKNMIFLKSLQNLYKKIN